VHLCSPRLSDPTEGHSGHEVEPHWRRGHWRLQPHGTGLSLLKLIWIRPTIVRRDKGEPDTPDSSAPHSGFSRVILAVVFLLFAYALSIGPVLKLSGAPPAPSALRAFYAPLVYLSHHVPAVETFYSWYLGLGGIPRGFGELAFIRVPPRLNLFALLCGHHSSPASHTADTSRPQVPSAPSGPWHSARRRTWRSHQ
jgi:hypothetical protein